MRSGSACVFENGLMWSLEAANSISDTVAMLAQRIEERSRDARDDLVAVYSPDELIQRPQLAAQAKLETGVMPAVEADADHRARRVPLAARLDQDAAELRARGDQVVRPLERRPGRAKPAQGTRHRDACDERQARGLARRPVQAAREGEGDACARRAVPAPAAPAAARGLLLGGEQHRAGIGIVQQD